jgi:hypothetical protein
MRDYFLDAQAAIDWAKTQIPVMQQRFIDWSRADPYEIAEEDDPQTGEVLVVLVRRGPINLSFNVETGTIINTIRSALDLLAAALAKRNGKNPSADTHFPIFRHHPDFIDPLYGVEGKKWLSTAEIAIIKTLRPYEGGDEFLWPFHHLDTLRKHERLVDITPTVRAFRLSDFGLRGTIEVPRRLEDKTILFQAEARPVPSIPNLRVRALRWPTATKGNTHLSYQIVFDEVGAGLSNKPVIPTLARYAARVEEIIGLF